MDVDIGKKAVSTKETGIVHIQSELLAGSGDCADCGSTGNGGEIYCIIIIAVMMFPLLLFGLQ